MKNVKNIFALVLLLAFVSSLTAFTFESTSSVKGEVCVTVKNDTGGSVTLHDGKGTIPMPNGTAKKMCKEAGSKLYFANKGQKGKLIFEFSSDLDGKKVNLSDY